MPHTDFELSEQEFLDLVSKSRYGITDDVRDVLRRVGYHWPAIWDNFVHGQILWTITEDYNEKGKYHFGYDGSNPNDDERLDRLYRNSLLHAQLKHYEYHMTFGYYAKKDYATLNEFTQKFPRWYDEENILRFCRNVEKYDEMFERRYESLGLVHGFFGHYGVLAWVAQKDPYFSGTGNEGKDNYAAVPIFHDRDAEQIRKFLVLKENEEPIFFVYHVEGAGNFRYLPNVTHPQTQQPSPVNLHPALVNFTVIPAFWFHAWRIQAPHFNKETGEVTYD